MAITEQKAHSAASGLRFQDGRIEIPAFALLDLSEQDLSGYAKMGVARLRVGNFRLRQPGRDVRRFAWSDAHQGESPTDQGQPMLNEPTLPGRRTRWDIDAEALFNPNLNDAQRVLIRVVLANGLKFPNPPVVPAITAKDPASQKSLSNLRVDQTDTRASFWALRPAGAINEVKHGFNIAVIASDSADGTFSLPLIIDPSVRNRG